jgi:raffinose/stachyose/melibiose transport system permease protein
VLAFAAPAVILYAFILLIPAIRGVGYAFTDWSGLGAHFDFVGITNFAHVLTDPASVRALIVTVVIAAVTTVARTVFGLLLALGVTSRIKSRNALRVLFFTPVVVTPIVAAYLFQYIFAPHGPINQILQSVGIQTPPNWLGDANLALLSIVILMVWRGAGYSMVIYIAGLQAIPDEIKEAAAIDGAGIFRKFRSIIFPLLAPATTISVMLALIEGLEVFGEVWILTGGGPGTATDTLSTSLYRNAFIFGDFGVGIAEAVLLFILVAGISSIQYRGLARQERRI